MSYLQNKRFWIGSVAAVCLGVSAFWLLRSSYNPFVLWGGRGGVPLNDPEYAKIVKILDQYQNADLDVVFDGRSEKPSAMWRWAKRYLQSHYKSGLTAERWISEYCYRNRWGQILYFKYPGGTTRVMRDVFLDALHNMEKLKIEPVAPKEEIRTANPNPEGPSVSSAVESPKHAPGGK